MSTTNESVTLPLLPLRDVVVFPYMVIPLFVGRQKSIKALEAAMADSKRILLVSQIDADTDNPQVGDLFHIGTVATVLQMLKLPDGTVKVLVEGSQRARAETISDEKGYFFSECELLETGEYDEHELMDISRSLVTLFEQYVKLSKKIPQEVVSTIVGLEQPDRIADTIGAHLSITLEAKQIILTHADIKDRLEHLLLVLENELDVLQVDKRIRGRVKQQMERSQREYYLHEQIKAIQKELSDFDETGSDLDELESKIAESGMPKAALAKAQSEMKKLKMMSPMSSEATVVRGYLDWLLDVPWRKRSRVKYDLALAKTILDEEHFGLEEVKERVLEYLAVQSKVKHVRGPVLCLVGPPGVGKTSLGQSIARATHRKYVRMALGGVRDEAEIRGHRRTYIGSMPGKLIQKLCKVGVKNPLFLLDEIDKMGSDMRGDPASALLEVLDPEQNKFFGDHYLEVEYDLSDVMFICTSNSMNIPPPLLDRMEVIRIPGYTEAEKVKIAQDYLLPKQIKENGLNENDLVISEEGLFHLIRHYTKEAGVRGLEREIAKLCRKIVKASLLGEVDISTTQHIGEEQVEEYNGVRKFKYGRKGQTDQVGLVTGLAWTSVGGELLTIEATKVPGKGAQLYTGSLGDVMQESIKAAMTVVRSRSQMLGLAPDFHQRFDLHVHVPEGATPKDGPSAGIGMCTALVSVLTGIPVLASVAMTGEITLRGEVLGIGGLKEKLLAAHRGGISTVLIPEENESELKEIPDNIKDELTIIAVSTIDQVLEKALASRPLPLSDKDYEAGLAALYRRHDDPHASVSVSRH